MIHNIPQPTLEQEFTNLIAEDANVALKKGFSIHAVHQVSIKYDVLRWNISIDH
jgi:hypothetical protein